jgi:hypothetical protein
VKKLGELFEINPTRWYKLTNNEILSEKGTIPLVTNSFANNGVMGFSKLQANNAGNTISCSDTTVGAETMFYQQDNFIGYQHIQHLVPKFKPFNRQIAAFIISATRVATKSEGFDYSHKFNRAAMCETEIQLPLTEDGSVDFAFIEGFVHDIERTRIHEVKAKGKEELLAYLRATGIHDYSLSEDEKATIKKVPKLNWQQFNLKELFGECTRGKRLKSSDRTTGTLPFVTAGENNTGISAFIGNGVEVFEKSTTTIDMFGSAKYRNYKYGADDHVAVVHTEELSKYAAIFITAACHKAAHTGEFDYGRNFYASDADNLMVNLPSIGNKPDYMTMETLISAAHKLVIADIVSTTNSRLAATKQAVGLKEQENSVTRDS